MVSEPSATFYNRLANISELSFRHSCSRERTYDRS